ncbi:hypothetical protein PHYBLDRAFT_152810 [Phycomyces blakesleeanus NRRL 1555(-)]|uniref:Tc1-like transposase DDE domain-containing protein n=1 Tax=Phycomyces blakesleeanus (strain ATCC 8743b / DSM 1359 / FGSC 10004 / NBRC 33097 / NRRL 1555) TaxID=763407 RepID=A0A162N5H2_PHYB8|nr:hypothetical protein PHYBLDRAFT_152810 [Phycomyces blakesleeanus NRRL 1555(-)]OAD66004.1 hypothetical protein PHYBLDRAFT_152810 [Phycomyces blakesleeanus NRRL 1555(-)]|eukprot:XP_018284044.1 hypothetical protein PHYBLDRAFT_152810 [Phycomyces blakesleeanus NRRL 1555(-)]
MRWKMLEPEFVISCFFNGCAEAIRTLGVLWAPINIIIDKFEREMALFIQDLLDEHCTLTLGQIRDKLLHNLQHHLHFLRPHSPFLNPIEECLSKLKTLVKRKSVLACGPLLEYIAECISHIAMENCQGWVDHSISFFRQCTNSQEIN